MADHMRYEESRQGINMFMMGVLLTSKLLSLLQEYISTGSDGVAGESCQDGQYHSTPTCGWARERDENGNLQDIPYGFIFHLIITLDIYSLKFSHYLFWFVQG